MKGKQVAYDLANEILESLEKSEQTKVDELITKNKLKWIELDKVERNNASLSYLANNKLFKMSSPQQNHANYELVEDFQNYTLLVLNAVEKGQWAEADDARKKQRETYISSFFANALNQSYIESLRVKADVDRRVEKLIQ